MNAWLKQLKVGDMVFVECITYTSLRKVEKITPAGNIRVAGIMFNSNGYERGGDSWNKCILREATQEAIAQFKEQATIAKAIRLMRKTPTVSIEQAQAIISLLEQTEKE